MAQLRTCIVCGRQYEFCPNCKNQAHANEQWRSIYCSDNCRQIFHVCSDYQANKITKQQAGVQLAKLNLPSKMSDGIKKNVQEITLAYIDKTIKEMGKPEIKKIENKQEDVEKEETKKEEAPIFVSRAKRNKRKIVNEKD